MVLVPLPLPLPLPWWKILAKRLANVIIHKPFTYIGTFARPQRQTGRSPRKILMFVVIVVAFIVVAVVAVVARGVAVAVSVVCHGACISLIRRIVPAACQLAASIECRKLKLRLSMIFIFHI